MSWTSLRHTAAKATAIGCKITETDTIYYCDNVEVGRHTTLPLSKQKPFFFLINLATGGGWPVDLSRYNGVADMYVDYVRVYSEAAADKTCSPSSSTATRCTSSSASMGLPPR
jgi:beta-glucanase (GH16 family)